MFLFSVCNDWEGFWISFQICLHSPSPNLANMFANGVQIYGKRKMSTINLIFKNEFQMVYFNNVKLCAVVLNFQYRFYLLPNFTRHETIHIYIYFIGSIFCVCSVLVVIQEPRCSNSVVLEIGCNYISTLNNLWKIIWSRWDIASGEITLILRFVIDHDYGTGIYILYTPCNLASNGIYYQV